MTDEDLRALARVGRVLEQVAKLSEGDVRRVCECLKLPDDSPQSAWLESLAGQARLLLAEIDR